MYNSAPTTSSNARFSESKYVADILSSMASGDPAVTPTYTLPNYVSSLTSVTTPTLTPTTLTAIEQTFIELQSVPVTSSGQDPLTQSGFVPPIVDPVVTSANQNGERYEYNESNDPDWSPAAKRARTDPSSNHAKPVNYSNVTPPSSTPGRKRRERNERVSPEEAARRSVRRERNKVAAAKCRQRRVDHTNMLIDETEGLETTQSELENEIEDLQQEKDQLEFILQAHSPLCKVQNSESITVKAEPMSTACTNPIATTGNATTKIRPNTLPVVKRESDNRASTCATGIPVTTPSTGLFMFGFDSMADGHTGLTPLTTGPTSCSSEVNRSSSEGSDSVTSPTLIAL